MPELAAKADGMRTKKAKKTRSEKKGWIFADLSASIVVFLVALPLCMGVAIASGVPPELGLITGIVGGIVAGIFPGSNFMVSGPAAGLTVLVYSTISDLGIKVLGPVVLLAGALQLIMALLRFGQWFRAISLPVVQGMLAGIGVLIVISQAYVIVDDKPFAHGIENLLHLPTAFRYAFLSSGTHQVAAVVGLLTLTGMILWKRYATRLHMIPPALVAIATVTVATAIFQLPIKHISVQGSLLDSISLPTLESLSLFGNTAVLSAALAFALIASAESLFSATAVDRMHNGPRTKYNTELFAQGVGNMVCGALGTLPMTGVIVRSAANVNAGARTRLSTVLHGVWLLVAVVLLPSVLNAIPTASLAGVLIYAGVKLVNPKAIRELWRSSKAEVGIYAGTVIAIVVTDLLKGVIFGLVLSLLKLLWDHSHFEARLHTDNDRRTAVLDLHGAATFVKLPKLATALESVPDGTDLVLNVHHLRFVDSTCLDLLLTWKEQHTNRGGGYVLTGGGALSDSPGVGS